MILEYMVCHFHNLDDILLLRGDGAWVQTVTQVLCEFPRARSLVISVKSLCQFCSSSGTNPPTHFVRPQLCISKLVDSLRKPMQSKFHNLVQTRSHEV